MATRLDLGALSACADWQDWVIDRDGVMWAPDTWRRGFTSHDIRSWFFLVQRGRQLERDLARTRDELSAALETHAALESRAAFYRRQLVLESRLGLALSRIAT